MYTYVYILTQNHMTPKKQKHEQVQECPVWLTRSIDHVNRKLVDDALWTAAKPNKQNDIHTKKYMCSLRMRVHIQRMYTYMFISTQVWVYIKTLDIMYAYVHVNVCIFAHAYIHTYTCIYICTYACKHKYTSIYIYILVRICICRVGP